MYKIYQVTASETLNDIAQKFGTTIDELRMINGLDLDKEITLGQYIIVPANQYTLFDEYTIQKGDTLYSIASKHQVSVMDLVKLNGLSENEFLYPKETLLVPGKNVQFYITEENDTLDMVVKKLKTNIKDVMEQNHNIKIAPEQLIVVKRTEIP